MDGSAAHPLLHLPHPPPQSLVALLLAQAIRFLVVIGVALAGVVRCRVDGVGGRLRPLDLNGSSAPNLK